MREIFDHHDGHGLTESIKIEADEPGPGGASHHYTAVMTPAVLAGARFEPLKVQFQKGPRGEKESSPGIVEAVLLAIVIDRMRAFNAGEYKCRENALVMTKCEEALHWLKHRADDRAKRKVLGTYEK